MPALNRSIIITGGTSGLGYHCAFNVARQCPEYQVVLASRTDPHSAAASINKYLGQSNVSFLRLDLSSLAEVRLFVKEWEARILLLNAGLQFPDGVRYTKDRIENTFAVNHVGHAFLFSLLRPHFADKARVVITASGTHDPAQKTGLPDAKYNTAEELAHPTPETTKNPGRQRYATSKLVNVMWAYALHRRFACVPGKSWTVTAFDPGLMPGTGLAREAGATMRFLWIHILPRMLPLLRRLVLPNIHTPKESGAALAWLAVSPDVEGTSGVYYEGRKQIKSGEESYDEKKQEELWQWTVKNIATNEDEACSFDVVN
ncbi:hypothetical protein V1527DRAFT_447339 [Lipomyces starkeyi]